MIDLGEFTPMSEMPPLRDPRTGVVTLSRKTSTSEQHVEAVRWMKDQMGDALEARAQINWSRMDATRLEIHVATESVMVEDDEDGSTQRIPVKVLTYETEYSLRGVEITRTRAEKSAQLVQEVDEMARGGNFA